MSSERATRIARPALGRQDYKTPRADVAAYRPPPPNGSSQRLFVCGRRARAFPLVA